MAQERLIGVSTRLLAGASALLVIGLGLAIRSSWQQIGQSFAPDGTATAADVPFANRATLLVYEFSYRPIGVQLLLASALVAAAVVTLHRHPSWAQVRWLRWEVLGAGLLVFVVAVGLALLNVYVMTAPGGADGDAVGWVGPQPLTELSAGNLTTVCASLLTLTGAMLWWLRLAPAPDVDPEESGEQEPVASDAVPGDTARDATDRLGDEAPEDYSRDWSPEDFRPPR